MNLSMSFLCAMNRNDYRLSGWMNKATVGDWLVRVEQALQPLSETSRLDAQVLLAHIVEKKRSWVLAHAESELSGPQERSLIQSLAKLQQGQPLPYVLGRWEFYGLDFNLSPHTLIPRPETELLVENALRWLRQNPGRRRALDVGAGSGCIGVSLAVKIPDLRLTALDISPEALMAARTNAEKHGVMGRVDFVLSDLLEEVENCFDLICANLPYIPRESLRDLAVAAHEPLLALDGGVDGLELIRRLLQQAPAHLAEPGLALFEIEASQGDKARHLGQAAFPQAKVDLLQDLSGKDRILRIEKK